MKSLFFNRVPYFSNFHIHLFCSLPKYESSHEFQTKKKRQQQRQQEEAAKRQKTQYPQSHARLPPIQQSGQVHPQARHGPANQSIHNAPPQGAGPSHHYNKPRGSSGGTSRYPQGANTSGGYNPNRGSQSGGYNNGPFPPQGRGPPPFSGSIMPGTSGPRGGGSYGAASSFPQGPYGPPAQNRGSNKMGGNRNQQQYGRQ